MQEQLLECLVVQGKDGKPVALVAVDPNRGVICLFDRSLASLPEIGRRIYTYNYEIRSKVGADGKERKYGVIYSWHYTKEEAEKELAEYRQRELREKLEKSVMEALAFVQGLDISEEDKIRLSNLVTAGTVPERLDTVDLLFFHKTDSEVFIAVGAQGALHAYPAYYTPREDELVKARKYVLEVDPEVLPAITRVVSSARVYRVKRAAYIVIDSRKEYRVAALLKRALDELHQLRLSSDLTAAVAEKIVEKVEALARKDELEVSAEEVAGTTRMVSIE